MQKKPRAIEYQNTTGRCNLCVGWKLAFIRADKKTSLNKRSELVSKCRHENRFYLSNFPPPISWTDHDLTYHQPVAPLRPATRSYISIILCGGTLLQWQNDLHWRSTGKSVQRSSVSMWLTSTRLLRRTSWKEPCSSPSSTPPSPIKRRMLFSTHGSRCPFVTQDREWIKEGTGLFDLTMGCHDSAETCQLLGTLVLATITKAMPSASIGLYRNDGLGVLWDTPGSKADWIRMDLIKLFAEMGLRITIQRNWKVADFPDETLNLSTRSYYPIMKPNDRPVYTRKLCNHLPNIMKSLLTSIIHRLTDICSDKASLADTKPLYDNALKANGFSEEDEYLEERKGAVRGAVSPTFTHTGIPLLSSGSVFDKSDNQPLYNIFYLCSTQSGMLAHIINTIICTSEIPRNFLALECLQC